MVEIGKTYFEDIVMDYTKESYHSGHSLTGIIQFLLDSKVSDSLILKAVHQVSPNFGRPELENFKKSIDNAN